MNYRTCDECNYDRHYCGGCGEHLSHGEYTCDQCWDEIENEER